MDRDRTPPPRRPTGMTGVGAPPGPSQRLADIEASVWDIRQELGTLAQLPTVVAKLSRSVDSLTAALNGPEHDPTKGIIWRVVQHDERRRLWNKVTFSIAIVAGASVIAWVANLLITVAGTTR